MERAFVVTRAIDHLVVTVQLEAHVRHGLAGGPDRASAQILRARQTQHDVDDGCALGGVHMGQPWDLARAMLGPDQPIAGRDIRELERTLGVGSVDAPVAFPFAEPSRPRPGHQHEPRLRAGGPVRVEQNAAQERARPDVVGGRTLLAGLEPQRVLALDLALDAQGELEVRARR